MFLTMLVVGLVGLVMMALPALGGHHLPGLRGHGHGLGTGHGAHAGHLAPGHSVAGPAGAHGGPAAGGAHAHHGDLTTAPNASKMVLATAPQLGRRFIPSPRAVFSVLALYGAFGNALVHAAHLSMLPAAVVAGGLALLAERILVRPVWNLLFRFQGEASSPLEQLILAEAQAVVPFRNGRGLISVVRDGRSVQLPARLCEQQAALPVAVGQRLRIEDVDSRQEWLTVSLLPEGVPARSSSSDPRT